MEEKYITSGQAAKLLGIHQDTLRLWEKNSKLKPHHKSTSGYKYYTEQQIYDFLESYYGAYDRVDDEKGQEAKILETDETEVVENEKGEIIDIEESNVSPSSVEQISQSKALTANYHYYSTAKPIRRLKEIYLNEWTRIEVGKTGYVDIKIWLDKNMQIKLMPTPLNTPEHELHPTDFDIFIIESVRSLKLAGNEEFTAAQLVRHMHGNSVGGISNEKIKRVEERLMTMMTWFIRIEMSEEFSHYPKIPEKLKGVTAIQGHLLDLIVLERKDKNNKTRIYFGLPLNAARYEIPKEKDVAVTHESYSKTIGKESCYDTKLLDVPGLKKTEEALLLTNYIVQQIQGLKGNRKGINTILFERIEKECGMENYTAKKKCRMRETLLKVMENCKEQGKIKKYEVIKQGNKYHSLKIEWEGEKKKKNERNGTGRGNKIYTRKSRSVSNANG